MLSVDSWIDVWIEVEAKCNLHCRFCYNYWRGKKESTPVACNTELLISNLKKFFGKNKIRKLVVSGGEPLLRPDIYLLLKQLNLLCEELILTTNGLLIDKKNVHLLADTGVKAVHIPLHSHRNQVHDHLSGGVKCWNKTVNSMILVKESGLNVVPSFVATSINLRDLKSVVSITSILGLKYVMVSRFVPSGLGAINRDELQVCDESFTQALEDIIPFCREIGIRIILGISMCIPIERLSPDVILNSICPLHEEAKKIVIGSNGDIRLCAHSDLTSDVIFNRTLDQVMFDRPKHSIKSSSLGCGIIEAKR